MTPAGILRWVHPDEEEGERVAALAMRRGKSVDFTGLLAPAYSRNEKSPPVRAGLHSQFSFLGLLPLLALAEIRPDPEQKRTQNKKGSRDGNQQSEV